MKSTDFYSQSHCWLDPRVGGQTKSEDLKIGRCQGPPLQGARRVRLKLEGPDSPRWFAGVCVTHGNLEARGWRQGLAGPCSLAEAARTIWEVGCKPSLRQLLLLDPVAILPEGRERGPESERSHITPCPTTQTRQGVCPGRGHGQPRPLGCFTAVISRSSPAT